MKTQKKYLNSFGFNLVELLIAVTIGMSLIYASSSLVKTIYSADQNSKKYMDSIVLRQELELALKNWNTCTCQVNPLQNLALASNLRIDTTLTTAQSFHLQQVRSSCDFAALDNFIVKEGENADTVGNGLKVNNVSVVDIRKTPRPNEYLGKLEVALESISPISIPFVFEVDSTQGTPNSRPILKCVGQNESGPYIKACPPGHWWVMVGQPDKPGTYCMERSSHPDVSYPTAVANCTAAPPVGFSRGKICIFQQLYSNCGIYNTIGFAGLGYGAEFFNEGFSATGMASTMGNGTCNSGPLQATAKYRCCIY